MGALGDGHGLLEGDRVTKTSLLGGSFKGVTCVCYRYIFILMTFDDLVAVNRARMVASAQRSNNQDGKTLPVSWRVGRLHVSQLNP